MSLGSAILFLICVIGGFGLMLLGIAALAHIVNALSGWLPTGRGSIG
jgi:hypothetical protein